MFNQNKNKLLLKCKIIRILILNIVKKRLHFKKYFLVFGLFVTNSLIVLIL